MEQAATSLAMARPRRLLLSVASLLSPPLLMGTPRPGCSESASRDPFLPSPLRRPPPQPIKMWAKARPRCADEPQPTSPLPRSIRGPHPRSPPRRCPPQLTEDWPSANPPSRGSTADHDLPSSLDDAAVAEAGLQTCGEFNVIHVANLCDIRLIDRSWWPEFFDDVHQDTERACRQYGEVFDVLIDEADATAWVKHSDVEEALECQSAMEGHYFEDAWSKFVCAPRRIGRPRRPAINMASPRKRELSLARIRVCLG